MPQNVTREKNISVCGDSPPYLLLRESGSCLRGTCVRDGESNYPVSLNMIFFYVSVSCDVS